MALRSSGSAFGMCAEALPGASARSCLRSHYASAIGVDFCLNWKRLSSGSDAFPQLRHCPDRAQPFPLQRATALIPDLCGALDSSRRERTRVAGALLSANSGRNKQKG